jgi:hypothetical protein
MLDSCLPMVDLFSKIISAAIKSEIQLLIKGLAANLSLQVSCMYIQKNCLGVPSTVREAMIQMIKDIPFATSMQSVGEIMSSFTVILGLLREHARLVAITPNMAAMSRLPQGSPMVFLSVEGPPSDTVIFDMFLLKLQKNPSQLLQVSLALNTFLIPPPWAVVNETIREVLVRHSPVPMSLGSMGSAFVANAHDLNFRDRDDVSDDRVPKHARLDSAFDYSSLVPDYPTQELDFNTQQEALQYNVNMAAQELANSSAALMASTRGGQSVYNPALSGSVSPPLSIANADIPLGVCRGFYRTGTCQFGNTCKFQHSRPSTGSSTAGAGPSRIGGGRGGSNLANGGGRK